MSKDQAPEFGRRLLVAGSAGLLGSVLADARPAAAQSAARRGTLVIGLDISDPTSLDPARLERILSRAASPEEDRALARVLETRARLAKRAR